MPFQPGQSGNPEGGRLHNRLRSRASALARQGTERNIALLEEIRDNTEASLALRARVAFGLLERGWGRSPQAVSLFLEDDHGDDAGEGQDVLPLVLRLIEEASATASVRGEPVDGAERPLLPVAPTAPPEEC